MICIASIGEHAASGGKVLSKMKDSSIHFALLGADFEHLGKGAHGEEVYKALWSTADVEHFIYVSDHRGRNADPKLRDLVLAAFGIKNAVAETFSCDAIHSYGGKVFELFKCNEPTSCAMRFGFERLDPAGWPIRIRSLSHNEIPERFCAFIAGHLVPTVGHVRSLRELLGLLIADMTYFPWSGSNGAIRAAQIIAIARQIGLGADHVGAVLEPRVQHIAAGGARGSEVRANPIAYLDKLLDEWDRTSK